MAEVLRHSVPTAEQRSEISQRAALARWGKDIPQATHEGEIHIGDEIVIPCAVLEDGTRLITQSGVLVALGRSPNPPSKSGQAEEKPPFLNAANLSPFISSELSRSWSPIKFRLSKARGGGLGGSGIAYGYKAEILPMVCHVFEDAERALKLSKVQAHIVEKARVLSRALSKTGIIALVDEATGYQYERAKDALARILEKFIAKELQPWTRTFPVDFYEEIFRLKGWKFDPATMQTPRVLGHYTNDFVYDRLAPGVKKELMEKNPKVNGRRKHKLFQWLTGEIGHPKLMAHIEGVKTLMKISEDEAQFRAHLEKVYPKLTTTELGLEIQVVRKPARKLINNPASPSAAESPQTSSGPT